MIDENIMRASANSPSYFYSDPLDVAFMAKHYQMLFLDERGRAIFPHFDKIRLRLVTEHAEIITDSKAIVDPRSLYHFQPVIDDIVEVEEAGFHRVVRLHDAHDLQMFSVGWTLRRVIQRGNRSFHWPQQLDVADVAQVVPEEWRSITGFEGLYEVSNLGKIRRIAAGSNTYAGRILKPSLNKSRGYMLVRLVRFPSKDHTVQLVHNIAAAAFHGPKPKGMHVNHIDGDKTNNAAANLEYVTPKRNSRHAIETGLTVRDLSPEAVRAIRAMRGQGAWRVADLLGVGRRTVSAIWSGRSYSDID